MPPRNNRHANRHNNNSNSSKGAGSAAASPIYSSSLVSKLQRPATPVSRPDTPSSISSFIPPIAPPPPKVDKERGEDEGQPSNTPTSPLIDFRDEVEDLSDAEVFGLTVDSVGGERKKKNDDDGNATGATSIPSSFEETPVLGGKRSGDVGYQSKRTQSRPSVVVRETASPQRPQAIKPKVPAPSFPTPPASVPTTRPSARTPDVVSDRSSRLETRSSKQSSSSTQAAANTREEDIQQQTVAEGPGQGHVLTPVLIREPSRLESISRTVRSYVPSIPITIPSALPSPPRVSRPLSFGQFMSPTSPSATSPQYRYPRSLRRQHHSSSTDEEAVHADIKRRGSNALGMEGPEWDGSGVSETGVFTTEEDDRAQTPNPSTTPQGSQSDLILWSRWDSLDDRRILILGYVEGLQLWDCSDLSSVSEMLNLRQLPKHDGQRDGEIITFAGILPKASSDDRFAPDRPLLGLTMTGSDGVTAFVVYSLSRNRIVKRLTMPNLSNFSCNGRFIVLSTTMPPTLHVLYSATFDTRLTISSTSLTAFARPPLSSSGAPSSGNNHNNNNTSQSIYTNNTNNNNNNNNVNRVSSTFNIEEILTRACAPQPVYALSGRLLAYACPAPPNSIRSSSTISNAISAAGAGVGGFGNIMNVSVPKSQAELGNAALKVGGGVLSGMRALGGLALTAASRTAGAIEQARAGEAPEQGRVSGAVGRFFSKSAPAAAETGAVADTSRWHATPPPSVAPSSVARSAASSASAEHALSSTPPRTSDVGHYVTVVDLSSSNVKPRTIAEFYVSRSQPVSELAFSADGTMIVVSTKEGQIAQMFQLRPRPVSMAAIEERELVKPPGSSPRNSNGGVRYELPLHVYDLKRGRTSAIIEGTQFTTDGRWLAVGTRNRTIHVFPVNPYGGKADAKSHTEGQVFNSSERHQLSTEVHPLVRFRALKSPAPEQVRLPLSFTFVSSLEHLSSGLLPLPTRPSSYSRPRTSSSPELEPTSPRLHSRPKNSQDLVVFDPVDGTLSLRRFFVDIKQPKEQSANQSGILTSMSLPTGRGPSPRKVSGLTRMMEPSNELVARESVVATWTLQRKSDWDEVRRVVTSVGEKGRPSKGPTGPSSLAEAELSTCSRSTSFLPRSIYLSHQISFTSLGEDYHALIRRHQFNIGGAKIEVRREVQPNAHAADMGESFVEGFSSYTRRDSRSQAASSFEEPLASALSAGIDYMPTTGIIPMLPNGTPGSRPSSLSLVHAIPMRSVTEGVSESFGRIRREMHRTRSPRSPNALSGGNASSHNNHHVPLEFDEEDEDFMLSGKNEGLGEHVHSAPTMVSDSSPDSATSPTPEIRTRALLEEEPEVNLTVDEQATWQGWEPEEAQRVVDDVERFDAISVVGFLEEEQEEVMRQSMAAEEAQKVQALLAKGGKKGKGKKKR